MPFIFDFLFGKKNTTKRTYSTVSTSSKPSPNRPQYQKKEVVASKDHHADQTQKEPPTKAEAKEAPSKSIVQPRNRFEVGEAKVTNKWLIYSNLETKGEVGNTKIFEVYCPMRPSIIYCHSILIDKLGDMTKFIISSLYHDVKIDDICSLTDMGEKTISEEVDYLINGDLIDEETYELTKLGREYGELLERFKTLSEGIPVYLNTYCNEFVELEESEQLVENLCGNEECVLSENFEHIYTRNDNYANSMSIASSYIQPEVPFSYEIKRSLYTTVNVVQGKNAVRYRKLVIKDINSRLSRYHGACDIPVLVPYKKVVFKPRYSVLNKYRKLSAEVYSLYKEFPELFQDDVSAMIPLLTEESKADSLEIFLNLSSGTIDRAICVVKEKIPDEIQIILEDNLLEIAVSDSLRKQITLEPLLEEEVYGIQYYPFKGLEAPDEKN